jgi:hypothetical protein
MCSNRSSGRKKEAVKTANQSQIAPNPNRAQSDVKIDHCSRCPNEETSANCCVALLLLAPAGCRRCGHSHGTTPSASSSESSSSLMVVGTVPKKRAVCINYGIVQGREKQHACEHGINLSGHLLCSDHRRHRFHCCESGVARFPRVNSPAAPAFPPAFGPHIAIPIRPTHRRQLFVNAANAASRVDSSRLLVTFVAVAGTYELTNN